jgi:hypothetical protein
MASRSAGCGDILALMRSILALLVALAIPDQNAAVPDLAVLSPSPGRRPVRVHPRRIKQRLATRERGSWLDRVSAVTSSAVVSPGLRSACERG